MITRKLSMAFLLLFFGSAFAMQTGLHVSYGVKTESSVPGNYTKMTVERRAFDYANQQQGVVKRKVYEHATIPTTKTLNCLVVGKEGTVASLSFGVEDYPAIFKIYKDGKVTDKKIPSNDSLRPVALDVSPNGTFVSLVRQAQVNNRSSNLFNRIFEAPQKQVSTSIKTYNVSNGKYSEKVMQCPPILSGNNHKVTVDCSGLVTIK